MKKLLIITTLCLAPVSVNAQGFVFGLAIGSMFAGNDKAPAVPYGIPQWCLNAQNTVEFEKCVKPFLIKYLLNQAWCSRQGVLSLRNEEPGCYWKYHLELIERGLKSAK